MTEHARYTKCTESWQTCRKCGKDGTHIGGLYYGDHDRVYCYSHVIENINPWRITSCGHCKDQIEQTGTVCNKCGLPL